MHGLPAPRPKHPTLNAKPYALALGIANVEPYALIAISSGKPDRPQLNNQLYLSRIVFFIS